MTVMQIKATADEELMNRQVDCDDRTSARSPHNSESATGSRFRHAYCHQRYPFTWEKHFGMGLVKRHAQYKREKEPFRAFDQEMYDIRFHQESSSLHNGIQMYYNASRVDLYAKTATA